jgi:hypothetical protein
MRSENTLAVISSLIILVSAAPCAADGAIVLGREGTSSVPSVYGYEVNLRSGTEAEVEAMRYCVRRGPNCRPHATFGGQCIVLFDARYPDGRATLEILAKPAPREALVDLDRGQTSRQMLQSIVRRPAPQEVLASLEREQISQCLSSRASCELKASDCDVTVRGARGPWVERAPDAPTVAPPQPEQRSQPLGPAPGRPASSKACQEFPELC